MKKLVNDKTQFVADMLKGLTLADDTHEVIADSVIVRKDRKKDKVALVSRRRQRS